MTRTETNHPTNAYKIRNCKVGTGSHTHAIYVRERGYRFPVCGQPRKGANAVHSVHGLATPQTVTCPKCTARLVATIGRGE